MIASNQLNKWIFILRTKNIYLRLSYSGENLFLLRRVFSVTNTEYKLVAKRRLKRKFFEENYNGK